MRALSDRTGLCLRYCYSLLSGHVITKAGREKIEAMLGPIWSVEGNEFLGEASQGPEGQGTAPQGDASQGEPRQGNARHGGSSSQDGLPIASEGAA